MARDLGLNPTSLIRNIPSPTQKWKAPVNEWVRSLYERKIGSKPPGAAPLERPAVIEFRNPQYPWPDRPEIPELVMHDDTPPDSVDDEDEYTVRAWEAELSRSRYEQPSDGDIDDQNTLCLRRQALYRWAAQFVARAMSELPEVQKVAAFGAAARPLRMEIPHFSQFRRHRIKVLHECADLDLAVWTSDLARLMELKRALGRGLSVVQNTPWGGVAHHQADVHIFDATTGSYRGRLCSFGQCPKPGKRECLVENCGAQTFLQQFEGYRFRDAQFHGEPKVVLFDRAGGFLVRPPEIDAKPTRWVRRPPREEEDEPY